MTRRSLLVACGVLLFATSLIAQSRGAAAADPISGTWTGDLILENGARRRPVTMALKYDGKRAVTGTVSGFSSPADVKAGTFDAKTGALMLKLGKKGESDVLLTLEGTVAKGTATGRVSGEQTADFKITKKAYPERGHEPRDYLRAD